MTLLSSILAELVLASFGCCHANKAPTRVLRSRASARTVPPVSPPVLARISAGWPLAGKNGPPRRPFRTGTLATRRFTGAVWSAWGPLRNCSISCASVTFVKSIACELAYPGVKRAARAPSAGIRRHALATSVRQRRWSHTTPASSTSTRTTATNFDQFSHRPAVHRAASIGSWRTPNQDPYRPSAPNLRPGPTNRPSSNTWWRKQDPQPQFRPQGDLSMQNCLQLSTVIKAPRLTDPKDNRKEP